METAAELTHVFADVCVFVGWLLLVLAFREMMGLAQHASVHTQRLPVLGLSSFLVRHTKFSKASA